MNLTLPHGAQIKIPTFSCSAVRIISGSWSWGLAPISLDVVALPPVDDTPSEELDASTSIGVSPSAIFPPLFADTIDLLELESTSIWLSSWPCWLDLLFPLSVVMELSILPWLMGLEVDSNLVCKGLDAVFVWDFSTGGGSDAGRSAALWMSLRE